nr:amidase family protein [Corynebacterium mendelii]
MDEMVVLFDRSIPVAGMSTSLGSGALKELSATRDSQVAARLTAAGAVILGHTNGDELHGLVGSHLPAGYSWLGGQVVDARDALWRSPGHGATGAAVAMAAGWADLAVVYGTPQQITEPAAIAGLYAAVLPRRCGIQGAVPAVGPQGHLGIIGRTPEDVALGQLVLCRSGIDTTNHAGDGGREDTTAAGTADSASTDSTTDTGTTVGARNSQPAGVKVTARRPRSAARTLTLVSAEDDPHIINAGKAHNLLFIPPTAQMNDLRRALADLPLDAATRVLGAQELDGWLAAQKKGPAGLTELAAFYADHPQQAPYGHDLIDAVADGREMSVDQAHAVVAEAEKLNRQLADLVRGAGAEGMMERGLGPFPLADADATRITVPFGEVNPNLAGDAYGDLSFVVTAFGRDSDEVAFTATRRLADGRADRF